jgi:hypothetical protein
MQSQFRTWVQNPDNLKEFRDRLPGTIDLARGRLAIVSPWQVYWSLTAPPDQKGGQQQDTVDSIRFVAPPWRVYWSLMVSPDQLGGQQRDAVESTLREVLQSFLRRDGARQPVEAVFPEAKEERAQVLASLLAASPKVNLSVVGQAVDRPLAAAQEERRQKLEWLMQSQFGTWLQTPDNLKTFRDRLPAALDLARGKLTIVPPWRVYRTFTPPPDQMGGQQPDPVDSTLTIVSPWWVCWSLTVPPDQLGGLQREKVEGTLRDVLQSFLERGGARQPVEAVFPKTNEEGAHVLATLLLEGPQVSLSVWSHQAPTKVLPSVVPAPCQTSYVPVSPYAPNQQPGLRHAQVSLGESAAPIVASSASPPTVTAEEADILHNQGYESYWAGNLAQALANFGTVTRVQPDRADAWYYRALCELALGDSAAARASLAQAVAVESRTRSTEQVSAALARVQGPTRRWIEEGRLAVETKRSLPGYLARSR